MARFYGFSHKEIMEMSYETFNAYWEAMTVIDAQECLVNMNVVAYPMMKKEQARKFHRDMMNMAYPKNKERAKRALTPAEIAQLLGAGRIK